MNAIRYDLERFHKHMSYDNNTLILAPRQSGKTFALVRKFVEERESALFVTHNRRYIDNLLVDLGCPDRRRDVYMMSESTLRGRRASSLFIDEIDIYDGNLQDVWQGVAPSLTGRITAVTTPTGRRHPDQYEGMFFNIFNMSEDRFLRTVTQGATERMKHEHFEKELFEI